MTRAVADHPLRVWIALAAVTALLSALAIAIRQAPNGMALVWLANAPTAALLCVSAPARWPALLLAQFVGVFVGASAVGLSLPTLSALTPLDLAEAALAAYLLRRFGGAEEALRTPLTIARFTLLAALVAPAATALGAGFALWSVTGESWAEPALRWPISHGLGMMVGFPLALKIVSGRLGRDEVAVLGGWPRLAGLVALVFVVAFGSFAEQRFPLLFLPVVPLVAVSLSFGRIGAVLGMFAVVIGCATARILVGPGPFAFISDVTPLGQLQYAALYLTALFATALPAAAVIEQRDALRRRLARSEAHFRALAEASSDGFVTLTAQGRIRYASSALRQLGGWDPLKLIGTDGELLIHPDHRPRVAAVHRAALAAPDEVFSVEYRALSEACGRSFWLESTVRAFQDPSDADTAVLFVSRDLSERKRREEELRRAADTDALTGLPNRAAFRRAAEGAMRRGEAGTLALLDLDHFKHINDRHGHAAGDAALRAVADLLRDAVRGEDMVARYGGEEFAILFRRLSIADASHAADRLAERLARAPIDIGHARLLLTTSIGLSSLTQDIALDAALARADESLYAAKRAGRNRVMAAA